MYKYVMGLIATLMIAAISPALAQEKNMIEQGPAPVWEIDQSQSVVEIQGTLYGGSFTADFDGIEGRILFDPENLKGSLIDVAVKIGSVKSASDEFMTEAQKPEWLYAEKYPLATYRSNAIFKLQKRNYYRAIGMLNLRGVNYPLDLDFQVLIADGQAVSKGQFMLDRLYFDIGQGEWSDDKAVSNIVDVRFDVVADLKP